VAKEVTVPAAISSLLWLPHLDIMRSTRGRIGIVTYDSTRLTMAHLAAAWPGLDPDTIALAGLEGTRMWRDAGLRDSVYDYDRIWEDLKGALDRLVDQHPSVELVLVECVTLCAFVPLIRQHLNLPTFDIVALARCWLDGLGPGGARSTGRG
jgi:hypothetical protein